MCSFIFAKKLLHRVRRMTVAAARGLFTWPFRTSAQTRSVLGLLHTVL